MNFITKNFQKFIANIIESMLKFFSGSINGVFDAVADVNIKSPAVVSAQKFTISFAITFVVALAVKKYFTTYVMETEGDPDSDPLDILVRCAQAIAIICCNSTIFRLFLIFSKKFCKDTISTISITTGSQYDGLVGAIDQAVGTLVSQISAFTFIYIVILLAIVIGLLAFSVTAGIRGAELSLMCVMCPLWACDLINTSHERWSNFFTKYVSTFLYYCLQLFAYNMFLVDCADAVTGFAGLSGFSMALVRAIGWFVLMLRGPKWMEAFIYTTGVGTKASGAIGSAVRYAGMVAMRR
ncbi:MAG: hypothetical protein KH230_09705 [Enterocloster asparagiformis]|nr:hypothetical protein [Enterocloster asparagiformis]